MAPKALKVFWQDKFCAGKIWWAFFKRPGKIWWEFLVTKFVHQNFSWMKFPSTPGRWSNNKPY